MKQQTSAEDVRRTNKLRGWLQLYRLAVPEELLVEWLERLRDLSPHEFDVSLDKAARENARPGFAPDPATVLSIAADMRSGETLVEHECPDCRGTRYQVKQTSQGKVAVLCHCASEAGRQAVQADLNKALYYSAEKFAKQERTRAKGNK